MALIRATALLTSRQVTVYKWSGVHEGDTFEPVNMATKNEKGFQVSGSFGTSGAIGLEGNLESSTSQVWFRCTTQGGSLINLTTPNRVYVIENDLWNRPVILAGTGLTLDIILMARAAM